MLTVTFRQTDLSTSAGAAALTAANAGDASWVTGVLQYQFGTLPGEPEPVIVVTDDLKAALTADPLISEWDWQDTTGNFDNYQ